MSYHPIFDTVAVAFLAPIVIGLTSPSSPLRRISLFALAYLTFHCLSSCPEYIKRSTWAAALGGYTLFSFLHYLDVAVLSGWSFDARGPTNDLINRNGRVHNSKKYPKSSGSHQLNIISRLKFGFSTFFSWRFVNTPYQVGIVPRLDKTLYSSSRFLFYTGWTILACYLVLDAMNSLRDKNITTKFWLLDKINPFSRTGEVSLRERYFATIGLGVSLISFQRGVYAIASFVCVAMGLSSPWDWPPFNGPILTSFSLRYIWSVFWPQANSHWLHALANYVVYNIFRLRKSGSLVRYMRICLMFAISGVIHIAIDFSSGIPVSKSGALRFFLIQPLGILIEDIISVAPGIALLPQIVQRFLSFIWLSLWMTWTAPGYVYPIIYKSVSGGGLVPFSIIGYLKQKL
ncbi:membrane bound O-acyl transferase family-domain-containing protein [Daldinia loculata]|nr:membrane bound O-acyl transferase family-domain-containing protein [Daldinia loculata]